MKKIGLLFPGQGAQKVGMGRDLAESFPEIDNLFEKAGGILNFDVKKLCFEGPEDELKDTRNTQPALFLISVCLYEIIKKNNFTFAAAAGHSLGEYAAYYAGGYFSFEQGLKIIQKRGQLMADADKEGRGTMAALIGLDDDRVKEICALASSEGIVVPANFNSRGQVVISGEKKAVETACTIADDEYATVIPLAVSGAFHSPMMESAAASLAAYMDKNLKLNSGADLPVISNITARPVKFENITDSLVKQVTSPVLWKESVEYMISTGIEIFIELGPKPVLTNMMKRINKKIKCFPADSAEKIRKVLEEIR